MYYIAAEWTLWANTAKLIRQAKKERLRGSYIYIYIYTLGLGFGNNVGPRFLV